MKFNGLNKLFRQPSREDIDVTILLVVGSVPKGECSEYLLCVPKVPFDM